MSSRFYYGTAGSDYQTAQSDIRRQNRTQNIADLLNGLGLVAQSVGAAHRAQQAKADQSVSAQFALASLEHPDGMPTTPLGPGQEGPQQPPTPWSDVAARQLRKQDQSPAGFFATMGSLFSPQGRLDPNMALNLANASAQRANQQQDRALRERSVAADELRAQAAMTTADATANRVPAPTGLAGKQSRADKLEAEVLKRQTFLNKLNSIDPKNAEAMADYRLMAQDAKDPAYLDATALQKSIDLYSRQHQDLVNEIRQYNPGYRAGAAAPSNMAAPAISQPQQQTSRTAMDQLRDPGGSNLLGSGTFTERLASENPTIGARLKAFKQAHGLRPEQPLTDDDAVAFHVWSDQLDGGK